MSVRRELHAKRGQLRTKRAMPKWYKKISDQATPLNELEKLETAYYHILKDCGIGKHKWLVAICTMGVLGCRKWHSALLQGLCLHVGQIN